MVYPSSISFSDAPTAAIWKKWSITAMNSNPASSAVRATVASSAPSRSGPRGVLKSGICKPIFIVGYLHRQASHAWPISWQSSARESKPPSVRNNDLVPLTG